MCYNETAIHPLDWKTPKGTEYVQSFRGFLLNISVAKISLENTYIHTYIHGLFDKAGWNTKLARQSVLMWTCTI